MAAIDIPTREEIRAMIREELRGARGTYSQRDGERPTGAGRERYLRAWRALRRAGDRDVRTEGRARLMTADAWARFVASERPTPRFEVVAPPLEISRSDRVLVALGGVRR